MTRSLRINTQAQAGPGHPACSGCSQQAGLCVVLISGFGQLWKLVPLSFPCPACSDLCTFQLYDINQ